MVLSIEHNLDLKRFERDVYNMWDLLSDVGGLQSILVWLISLMIAACNTNYLDNVMAKRLYRTKNPP